MKEQWQALSARFGALEQREKMLICAAVLAAIVFAGYNFWIGPAQTRKALANKQIALLNTDMNTARTLLVVSQQKLQNPDAASLKGIEEMRQGLADMDRQLAGFNKVLVAPGQMTLVLQELLAGHRGLELVSLKTLAPQSVIAEPVDSATTKPAEPPKPEVANAGNIYRHGIEIKVAGGYQDLLAYMSDLEQSPQRLMLGRMNFSVTRYPRVELTLTVYSLSLDRTWLVV